MALSSGGAVIFFGKNPPGRDQCIPFPASSFPLFLLYSIAYYYHTLRRGFNMPTALSFETRKSAFVIALVLVPIVILFLTLAVALACSEYWSSRPSGSCFPRLCGLSRKHKENKESYSEPASSSTTGTPRVSTTPFEYGGPVVEREDV